MQVVPFKTLLLSQDVQTRGSLTEQVLHLYEHFWAHYLTSDNSISVIMLHPETHSP